MADDSSIQEEEIRRALKIAKARQYAVKSKMVTQNLSKSSSSLVTESQIKDLKESIKNQAEMIENLREQLTAKDLELRENKFELNRLQTQFNQHITSSSECMQQNSRKVDSKQKQNVLSLRQALDRVERQVLERSQLMAHHCDKIAKLIDGIIRHGEHSYRPLRQDEHAYPSCSILKGLLEKVKSAVVDMKQFLGPNSLQGNVTATSQHQHSTSQEIADQAVEDGDIDHDFICYMSRPLPTSSCDELRRLTELASASKSEILDNALLDMCSNLEEENSRLQDCISVMKRQMADSSRENSVSKLIPHYRLGIIRARNLAANLQDQLVREQKTSQILREQLEATYNELRLQRTVRQQDTIPASVSGENSSYPTEGGRSKDVVGKIYSQDRELMQLDTEISSLKEQLQRAALKQTHTIMSQVLDSVRPNFAGGVC